LNNAARPELTAAIASPFAEVEESINIKTGNLLKIIIFSLVVLTALRLFFFQSLFFDVDIPVF
jgi:hypothetical protein